MYYILIAAGSLYLCYKYGDWRNWMTYYPTILFFMLSNVVCAYLIFNHPLWFYESSILNRTFCDLFICITVYPSTIMVFIPHFPKKIIPGIIHISYYVWLYVIVEFIAVKLGYFSYHNGWNIACTIVFNYIMFSILMLHHKKPLYAWMIALVCPHILFFLMKIPYSSIR